MDDASTSRPHAGSGGGDPERAARLHVHLALASIALAFAAPLVSWTLWSRDRGRRSGVWGRRLLALAILDTALVVALAVATALGLDEPAAAEAKAVLGPERRAVGVAAPLEIATVGALALFARRRGVPVSPGLAVVLGLVALPVASTIAVLTLEATVGLSLGALVVSMLAGSAALLAAGLLARPFRREATVQLGPRMGTAKAVALGVLYGVTGAVRVAVVLTIASALGAPVHTASDAFGIDETWSPPVIALFFFASVVVAPVAEEVVFRGVLLPWLTRFMRPSVAVAITSATFAVGHLYYGAGVLLIAHYGVVLGWARLRTGNLGAPIALHALLNGATAIVLFTTRGG